MSSTTSQGSEEARSEFRPSLFFSLLGNVGLFVATIVVGFVASIVGWIPPRGTWMFEAARVWSWALLLSGGVRLESRFETPLEKGKGYIFMANHQSLLDIPALIAQVPGEVRFMAKKSLFRIPLFGWALTAGGFIPVDRGNKKAVVEIYQAATRCLSSGRSILIFPEQTRSTDGKLLPFKRGGAVIALETGHAIVPVGIQNTRHARPIGSFWIYPGTVTVNYGKPIEVKGRSSDDWPELLEQVRHDIDRLL